MTRRICLIQPRQLRRCCRGVGYGEVGEKGVEKGLRDARGYADDITYTLMLAREVDNMMFGDWRAW